MKLGKEYLVHITRSAVPSENGKLVFDAREGMKGLTGIVGFVGQTVELGAFDDCHYAGTGE